MGPDAPSIRSFVADFLSTELDNFLHRNLEIAGLLQKKILQSERERKEKTVKTVIKEIRFGPNTDEHDFEFKVKHARNFLGEGAKVRAYVQFRGRSIVFQDRGELLLLKFMKELEEFGTAEALPKLEGKRMGVLISPKKKK